MLYHNVHMFARSLRLADTAILAVGSVGLWFGGASLGLWSGAHVVPVFLFAASLALSFLLLTSRWRTYHARRTESVARELTDIGAAAICAVGVGCLVVQVTMPGLASAYYATSAIAAVVLLVMIRAGLRLLLRYFRRHGKDLRAWILIGRNDRSADLALSTFANPSYGIQIVGVVDLVTNPARMHRRGIERWSAPELSSIPLSEIREPDEIREILVSRVVDEVVVCLPVRSFYDEIGRLVQDCAEAGVAVKFFSQVFEAAGEKTETSHIGGTMLVTHYTGPVEGLSLSIKRLIDIIGAGAGLILLSPLLAACAVAIKLDSPGPVLFKQTRVGLHGRQFKMLKFRTMVANASKMHAQLAALNQVEAPAFKIKKDPRITRVGGWLRKHHIDEFPQLWNVLTGEMSIVGPRPMPLYAAGVTEWWQRRRYSVPPGLTCLWQINDDREKFSFQEWMRRDLEYIDRWSLWLDLRLIAATLGTVIRGSGW